MKYFLDQSPNTGLPLSYYINNSILYHYSINNKLNELKFVRFAEEADRKIRILGHPNQLLAESIENYDLVFVDNTNEGHDYSQFDYELINKFNVIIATGNESPVINYYKSKTVGFESWDVIVNSYLQYLPGILAEVNNTMINDFSYDYLVLVGTPRAHRLDFLKKAEEVGILQTTLYKKEDLLPFEVYFNLCSITQYKNYTSYKLYDDFSNLNIAHVPHRNMFNVSAVNIILETTVMSDSPYPFLTEKTYKCLMSNRPFTLLGDVGSLRKLRSDGFRTFSEYIDESYDLEPDLATRTDMVIQASIDLREQLRVNFDKIKEICQHNQLHFLDLRRLGKRYEVFGNTIMGLFCKFG